MSAFFSPSSGVRKTKAGGPIKTALSTAIAVPVLPSDASEETRLKFLLGIAATGASESPGIEAWKVYIAAYSVCIVPPLQARLTQGIYRFVPLSAEAVTAYLARYDALSTIPDDHPEEAFHAHETSFWSTPVMPGFPPLPANKLYRFLPWEENGKVSVCHYSIVLFMAGKRVEGDDHTPITQKRPDAVIKKAHLEGEFELLKGSLRVSDIGHPCINSAWAESAILRSTCITAFSEYEASDTDVFQDIIYTTMHLLKYSGMQHAKIIHGFLQAYPWAAEVPSLRMSISTFHESAKAALKYDERMRPYVKLVLADKATIFPRKEMEPLIACAVSATEEVSPSLAAFYTSSDFVAIVEAFLAERDRRLNIRDMTLRAQEIELMDQVGHVEEEGEEEEEGGE